MPKTKEYVLIKPIIIPAGTRLALGPKTREYAAPHFEALLGYGKDHCGSLMFDEDLIEAFPDSFAELR